MSEYRTVTPVPEVALPQVWRWMQEFSELMVDDNCPMTYQEMVDKRRRDLSNGAIEYAFLDPANELVGCVWFEAMGDAMYIGHLVFDGLKISSGDKLALSKEAIGKAFDAGARKLIWQMFDDNMAFRVFLTRLGAELEGTLKQGTRRHGQLVDLRLMASFPKRGIA